jgi:fibronectin-binding autotransporter adhesin
VDQSIDTVFAGNLGGAGSLIKEGDGTLALNGSGPSFSGTTTVNDGTLLVNGSLSGSNVLLNDATLGGIGAVGSVNSIGGAIAPGASAGTLSTAGLSLDSTSLWDFELATAGVVGSGVNDLILVNGALTLDGILDVTPLPGFGAGTYRLASYTGGFVDNGLEIDPAFLASYPGSSIDTTNVGEVNLIVIPEPGSVVLLIGGLAIATASRRRRPAE